ncbi:MAG: hypothetical protein LUI13_13785 [Lachnospiraceae bacterium]|nr:hypothetical protein [Lachnospiraceae bacterium]
MERTKAGKAFGKMTASKILIAVITMTVIGGGTRAFAQNQINDEIVVIIDSAEMETESEDSLESGEETNESENNLVLSRVMQYSLEELLELEVVNEIPYTSTDMSAVYETGVFCIAEIPEENIRMYIYYDEEIGFQGAAFSIGNDVYYFDWPYTCFVTYLPELFWDEESQRLLVKCYKNRGTGCAVQELYVLQKSESGIWIASAYKYEEYTEAVCERISLNIDEQGKEYTITDNITGEILDQNVVVGDIPCSYDFWKFDVDATVTFAVNVGYYMCGKLDGDYYYFSEMETLCFDLNLIQNDDGSITFEIGDFLGYEEL